MHFYAKDSNDVLLRAGWFAQIKTLMEQDTPDSVILAEIDILLATLPLSSAKKYSVWSNVKCPKCRNEFPYRFKENLKLRLEDTGVILIDGCVLDSDKGIFLVNIEKIPGSN